MPDLPWDSYARLTGQLLITAPDGSDADANPDGVPPSGAVWITPSHRELIRFEADGVGVVGASFKLDLDDEGYISLRGSREVLAPPTQDDAADPDLWHYIVSFDLKDRAGKAIHLPRYLISAPAGEVTDVFTTDSRRDYPGDAARPEPGWYDALDRLARRVGRLEDGGGPGPGEPGAASDASVAALVADDDSATSGAVDDRVAAGIAGKADRADLAGKADADHTHVVGDVDGLQTELDGKAPSEHTHAIGDVDGLQAELDGKAPSEHTHTSAQIDGLDGKQAEQDERLGELDGLVEGKENALAVEPVTQAADFTAAPDTHYRVDASSTWRMVYDGATVKDSKIFKSALAGFAARDVGHRITGPTIPRGAVIESVTSATEVVMSLAVTEGSASGLPVAIGSAVQVVTLPDGAADGTRVRLEKTGTDVCRVRVRPHPDSEDTISGPVVLQSPGSVGEWRRAGGGVWRAGPVVGGREPKSHGAVVAVTGDSIAPPTLWGDSATARARRRAGGVQSPNSWATYLHLDSGGRVLLGNMTGIGGERGDQISHRIYSTLDRPADIVVIDASMTNSSGSQATIDQFRAQFIEQAEAVEAAGAIVACHTGYPVSPGDTAGRRHTDGYRQWLRTYAARKGYIIADTFAAVSDASGNWKSGLNADSIHPNPVGKRVIAKAVLDALAPVLSGVPLRAQFTQATDGGGGSSSILYNGLLQATYAKDGKNLPNNWAKQSGPLLFDTFDDDADFMGRYLKIADTGTSGSTVLSTNKVARAGLTGKRVGFVFEFKNLSTGTGEVQVKLTLHSSTAPVEANLTWSGTKDASPTDGVRVCELSGQAPADCDGWQIDFAATGGDGLDQRYGQFRVDVTDLGD